MNMRQIVVDTRNGEGWSPSALVFDERFGRSFLFGSSSVHKTRSHLHLSPLDDQRLSHITSRLGENHHCRLRSWSNSGPQQATDR